MATPGVVARAVAGPLRIVVAIAVAPPGVVVVDAEAAPLGIVAGIVVVWLPLEISVLP